MYEVSVVIPVYNKKKYIKKTVMSILNQTFGNYELILVDDGSTDGSGTLCDELASIDERITAFHTENKGVGAARNFGFKKATGTYICFIDADDYVNNTFLEKLYTSIKSNDAGLSVCGYYEIKEGIRRDFIFEANNKTDVFWNVLTNDVLCVMWNKLFVRDKIKHLFDETISTSEDSLFCARYYLDNLPKIAYVDEILYGYTIHNDGLSSHFQKSAIIGTNRFFIVNRKISELITDKKLKKQAIFHIYKVYFYGIYTFIFENISKGDLNKDKLSIISKIIKEKKYKRITRYIFRYSLFNKKVAPISKSELCYLVFSLLNMRKMIFIFPKVKRWVKSKISR